MQMRGHTAREKIAIHLSLSIRHTWTAVHNKQQFIGVRGEKKMLRKALNAKYQHDGNQVKSHPQLFKN
jgi:hypothetical protein